MIDKSTKEAIIEFVESLGGKENCGLSWNEIGIKFNLKPCEKTKKALSDAYRHHCKKNSNNLKKQFEVPEGFEVSALYGPPDNFQVSLRRKNSVENLNDEVKKVIEGLTSFSPKVSKIQRKVDNKLLPIAYEVPIQDFHFGREPIDYAVKKYRATVYNLVARVLGQYHIEKFIFPVGNDLFNSDNGKYTTTKGTPQFDYNQWTEVFDKGSKAVIEVITTLSNYAPVEVILVPGNHDFEKNHYLGCVIDAWFRNDENVFVDNSFVPFKFTQYGKCMIMYEHGELKSRDYPIIMATEQPQMFSETLFREVHTGHFHKEMQMDEVRGVKVRFIPSLAKSSTWEKFQGYNHLKCAQGFKWHAEAGLIGIEQLNDTSGVS